MKKILWALAAGLLMCTLGIAKPQNTAMIQLTAASGAATVNDHNDAATADATAADQTGLKVRILTGCLYKTSANEYTLRGEFPNSWQLQSNSAHLARYVNEEVRVIVFNKPENDGTLIVYDLWMVSADCFR
jgi:hypothetical protein